MKGSVVATILFADLMNSTEMAKNLTLQEYDGMLVDFQSTMFEVVSDHLNEYGYAGDGIDSEWSVVGDEVRLFLYSGMVRFDVRNALLIATKMKIAWLIAYPSTFGWCWPIFTRQPLTPLMTLPQLRPTPIRDTRRPSSRIF